MSCPRTASAKRRSAWLRCAAQLSRSGLGSREAMPTRAACTSARTPAVIKPIWTLAAEATKPPSSGPSPKPSETELELKPKTVAYKIDGASSPIMAPNAGINAPLKKLPMKKVVITSAGLPLSPLPNNARPITTAPMVTTAR